MAKKWFGPCLLVLQTSCSTAPGFSTIETEQAGAALGHQGTAPQVTDPDYTLFEAGAVRPIASAGLLRARLLLRPVCPSGLYRAQLRAVGRNTRANHAQRREPMHG